VPPARLGGASALGRRWVVARSARRRPVSRRRAAGRGRWPFAVRPRIRPSVHPAQQNADSGSDQRATRPSWATTCPAPRLARHEFALDALPATVEMPETADLSRSEHTWTRPAAVPGCGARLRCPAAVPGCEAPAGTGAPYLKRQVSGPNRPFDPASWYRDAPTCPAPRSNRDASGPQADETARLLPRNCSFEVSSTHDGGFGADRPATKVCWVRASVREVRSPASAADFIKLVGVRKQLDPRPLPTDGRDRPERRCE
jgi:hypothetical protein